MRIFTLLASAILLAANSAQAAEGIYFSHGDWELVCDNTGTCRAAGYHEDGSDMQVSVLLTRKAGPDEPVEGQLTLGTFEEKPLSSYKAPFTLTMRIDERKLGQSKVDPVSPGLSLSQGQVSALLAALRGSGVIEWVSGKHGWELSGKGAAAVLLKMDEYQGRIGTRGALVRKGQLDEIGVRKPSPPPVVLQAQVAATRPSDNKLGAARMKALRQALNATIKPDHCPELLSGADGKPAELSLYRLSANRMLVSGRCMTGAYQASDGFWVIEDNASFRPVLVTNSAEEYDDGVISASFKGRGIGDCRNTESWTWDGRAFVHTASSITGMCRLVTLGGTWDMPTLVTDVKKAAR